MQDKNELEAIQKLSDPRWRLNHLYSIVDKNSEKILFQENVVQARINDCTYKRKNILKARQFGVSTNEILKQFDFTIWNKNKTCAILAHEQDSIKKLFRIVARAYDFLDDDVKPELDRGGGSKYEYFFPELNSRIYCDLESRGDTINWLHVSECAFMKDELKLNATLQAVPLNGRVTIETTPNGLGNHYYDLWSNSDIYERLFFPWFIFPEYKIQSSKLVYTNEEELFMAKARVNYKVDITDHQLAFRRFKKEELRQTFTQEYPEDDQTCFLATGLAIMDLKKVKDQLDLLKPPLSDDGEIRIYEKPIKGKFYTVGADTSEGIGQDFSVGVLFRADNREQVAILRGRFPPSEFAHKLKKLCEMYRAADRWPELAVERNNHGHAVLLELNEHIRYSNLFKAPDGRVGWVTDRVTRPIMLSAFIEGVENQTIKIKDKEILFECLTLIVKNGKIQASAGKRDDTVIASSIGLQLCIQNKYSLYQDIGSHIYV